MSARAMAIPGSLLLSEDEGRGRKLLENYAAHLEALGVPAAERGLNGLEDSARFAKELLRPYEVLNPLPWHRGGLNE